MLTATTTTTTTPCPFCESDFPPDAPQCPSCHASAAWADLQRANDFARKEFQQWSDRHIIHADQWTQIDAHYAQLRDAFAKSASREGAADAPENGLRPASQCWDCANLGDDNDAHCWYCGAPADRE